MLDFSGTGAQIQAIEFPYRRSADQGAATPARHPVVIVGAGPVGLSLAIDLAQRGQRVVLLDNDHRLSTGSRAICFAKRTLEIWDRLGAGQRMVDKGVSWQVGKVFFGDQQVYQFDLLPEAGIAAGAEPPQADREPPRGAVAEGHRGRTSERPAFINLQQYYAEAYLVERALQLPLIDLRWKHEVIGLHPRDDHATLTVRTPDGEHTLEADWLIACDGSRSPLRGMLGLESKGRVFRDRFLIADIRMAADFPPERWFWFDPPFHRGWSTLLHRQPDGVWRIDWQLGWDADPEAEKQPEAITRRVKALLGEDAKWDLEWASVYTFSCERMDRFVHGRVLFAGDAAHRVSPFGARGANSGVQDAENLAWKLDAVLRGQAPAALIDSYGVEREYAADENILNSSRATDFITPKSEVSRLFRDAVLDLAREHAFARRLVNSGRLSVPATLHGSPLNTPDTDDFAGAMVPGAVAADAPVTKAGQAAWLLRELGPGFTLLVFGDGEPAWAASLPVQCVRIGAGALQDPQGHAAARYDAQPGTAYLIRPDQHVAARWRVPDAARVLSAIDTALGKTPSPAGGRGLG